MSHSDWCTHNPLYKTTPLMAVNEKKLVAYFYVWPNPIPKIRLNTPKTRARSVSVPSQLLGIMNDDIMTPIVLRFSAQPVKVNVYIRRPELLNTEQFGGSAHGYSAALWYDKLINRANCKVVCHQKHQSCMTRLHGDPAARDSPFAPFTAPRQDSEPESVVR